MDATVKITNPDGKFSVYENAGSAIQEVERYNTQAEAVDAVGKLLGADAKTYSVVDLAGRTEVYSITWPGAAPVADPAPADKASAK